METSGWPGAFFDGHAGWQMAALLEKQLLPFIRHSLSNIQSTSGAGLGRSDELVQKAIKQGFVDLDDAIAKAALSASQNEETLYFSHSNRRHVGFAL